MIAPDRQWHRLSGAGPSVIEDLKACSPVPLPQSYIALLEYSNGGEGPLPVQPYCLCLDPAEVTAKAIREGEHSEFFAGFLIFGSNGGGEFLALDYRGGVPFPVVSIDMTNIDLGESVQPVASDFEAFAGMIGAEPK